MLRLTRSVLVLATAASCVLNLSAQKPVAPVDLPQRDPATHWPAAFNPDHAPVFSHNELLLHAGCHHVWTTLTDVTAWPTWFVLTKDVSLDHPGTPLAHGTLIHLKIFGSPINSRIDEFVPDTRLSWIPQGLDEPTPSHYHTWRLVPQGPNCRVITEESGIGPNDHKSPAAISRQMHKAHELWLASLQWKAED